MKTLSEKLRVLRQGKGWSQEDIAHELGISLPAYSKIERGITNISLSRLNQIGSLFGLSAIGLLAFGEDTTEKTFREQLDEKDKEIMRLQKKLIEVLESK